MRHEQHATEDRFILAEMLDENGNVLRVVEFDLAMTYLMYLEPSRRKAKYMPEYSRTRSGALVCRLKFAAWY